MGGVLDFDDEFEWLIWNSFYGVAVSATVSRVELSEFGKMAWMDEPFEMLGPFNLDELETTGRVAFAACIILSPQRWGQDQAQLRIDSQDTRRKAQQRMNEKFSQFNQGQNKKQSQAQKVDEKAHRKTLNLPGDGKLVTRQITTAYRRLAQKVHPDRGGSNEQFVSIQKARDALLAMV